ncbi:MAG: hypothetical protein IKU37_04665 [Candidatus Gastranaerophilales bacterium]|nr:hypothetical protein [Candidatus Gastranaerophilales bacterium]
MLDKILTSNSEIIDQSQSLDRIKGLGVSNPYEVDKNKFFIDESSISTTALEKYQKELDVKKFSDILFQTDEKAANELVLQQAFEGIFSIDETDFLSELLDNKDLLNDIAE